MTKIEDCPFVSMRLGALRIYGGDLVYLRNSKRFEQRFWRSRGARTVCRKDFRINGSRNYKPWQFNKGSV